MTVTNFEQEAALNILIDGYLRGSNSCSSDNRCICADEFETPSDLAGAIRIACDSITKNSKCHPHQRRIPTSVRGLMKKALLLLQKEIRACANFDDLHGIVSAESRKIKGSGELYTYDVAQRIGCSVLELVPEFVYLHAGTRRGARALGIKGEKASLDQFPAPIQRLTPSQAEDFLCIYKGELRALALSSHFQNKTS